MSKETMAGRYVIKNHDCDDKGRYVYVVKNVYIHAGIFEDFESAKILAGILNLRCSNDGISRVDPDELYIVDREKVYSEDTSGIAPNRLCIIRLDRVKDLLSIESYFYTAGDPCPFVPAEYDCPEDVMYYIGIVPDLDPETAKRMFEHSYKILELSHSPYHYNPYELLVWEDETNEEEAE